MSCVKENGGNFKFVMNCSIYCGSNITNTQLDLILV